MEKKETISMEMRKMIYALANNVVIAVDSA